MSSRDYDRLGSLRTRIADRHAIISVSHQCDILSGIGLCVDDPLKCNARLCLLLIGVDQISGAAEQNVVHS